MGYLGLFSGLSVSFVFLLIVVYIGQLIRRDHDAVLTWESFEFEVISGFKNYLKNSGFQD